MPVSNAAGRLEISFLYVISCCKQQNIEAKGRTEVTPPDFHDQQEQNKLVKLKVLKWRPTNRLPTRRNE